MGKDPPDRPKMDPKTGFTRFRYADMEKKCRYADIADADRHVVNSSSKSPKWVL